MSEEEIVFEADYADPYTEGYREGYVKGYDQGVSDGNFAGYRDAKMRAFRAMGHDDDARADLEKMLGEE